MTPDFAQAVNKIFDAVLDLLDRIELHEKPELTQEKALIRQDLDELVALASRKPGYKVEDLELAQRLLTYWVDEVLTFATNDWREMPLEFDYFGEVNRAWRFYEFGEREARSSSPDVIEVCYLCLVLGFEGDVGEAFREHLHLPLPGNASNSARAREIWAGDFARLIRKPASNELTGEPMTGGVEPLTGATWLQTMFACCFVASVGFLVFGAIFWFYCPH